MVKKRSSHPYLRSCLRDLKGSLGRYIAILLIVTLGVGFFAGLRSTEPSMTATAQSYLEKTEFYDFRLLSSFGFDEEDVKEFNALEGIVAEGEHSLDVLIDCQEITAALRVHNLTTQVNTLSFTSGRLPETSNECVVDANRAEDYPLGATLTLSSDNSADAMEALSTNTFTVVGHARSPLYLNFERGTTTLENGSLAGFLILPNDAFVSAPYTTLYLNATISAAAYTDAYDASLETYRDSVESLLTKRGEAKRDKLKSESLAEIAQNQATLDTNYAAYENEKIQFEQASTSGLLTPEQVSDGTAKLVATKAALDAAQAELNALRTQAQELSLPTLYTMTRSSNTGFAAFENDSQIVSAISVVFPLLFLLVAILVCMTTMSRMVDENRTQIGTLKSLGYTAAAIHGKFQLYSGSAALIGWLCGYFLGTIFIPELIWNVYRVMYGFADLTYQFSLPLFLICLLASIGCACGASYFACRSSLSEQPAQLLRPKAPRPGKKIFLERLPLLWRRLSFLHKVSARNVFRYKNRLFMMILGIGGCTALLVTGFGLNDSISNIASYQFDEIMTYDYAATVSQTDADAADRLIAVNGVSEGASAYQTSVDATAGDETLHLYLLSSSDEKFSNFIDLHNKKQPLVYPSSGDVLISRDAAKKLSLKVGDTLSLQTADLANSSLTISGIFDNYIYNYVILNPTDAASLCGDITPNTVYLRTTSNADKSTLTTTLLAEPGVLNLITTDELVTRVASSLNSIKGIVAFVVICAAALAFVVLYNLSNINIEERVREIATIKVLGFRRGEVSAYIFREIFLLTVLGTIIGLPLGKLLHLFVINQITVDQVSFEIRISPLSYLFSAALTILFAAMINLFMTRRLRKIDMSGSLKSVD